MLGDTLSIEEISKPISYYDNMVQESTNPDLLVGASAPTIVTSIELYGGIQLNVQSAMFGSPATEKLTDGPY